MFDPTTVEISFRLHRNQFVEFHPLLRRGFRVSVPLDSPLHEVLTGECGVPELVLQDRVQTVFLDGQPVDRLDFALGSPDRVLALSAAMPGLAGAIMRKGGYCAGLRDSISCRDRSGSAGHGRGWLHIRLYNFMASELGPVFLQKGITVTGEELQDWLNGLPDDCPGRCAQVRLDGKPVTGDRFPDSQGIDPQTLYLLRAEPSA